MKLDLRGILKDVVENTNLSIPKSTDNSVSTGLLATPPLHSYLIVDASGLKLTETSDEILADKGLLLKAVLLYEFYDIDTEWQSLCALKPPECDNLCEIGMLLDNWYGDIVEDLRMRFDFLVGMRPYTPTDIVHIGDIVLIEMTYFQE